MSNHRVRIQIFALFPLIVILATGCASVTPLPGAGSTYQAQLPVSADRAWIAAMSQFQGLPIQNFDPASKSFETIWMEGFSGTRANALKAGAYTKNRRERMKISLRVWPLDAHRSRLSIRTQSEVGVRKARGGYRWESVPSDGALERELMARIKKNLKLA